MLRGEIINGYYIIFLKPKNIYTNTTSKLKEPLKNSKKEKKELLISSRRKSQSK